MKKHTTVELKLTKKEAEFLSSLVEAQVSRLVILNEKNLEPYKDEFKAFKKMGGMLSLAH